MKSILLLVALIAILNVANGFVFTRFNRPGTVLARVGLQNRPGLSGLGLGLGLTLGFPFGPFGFPFGKRETSEGQTMCSLNMKIEKMTCMGEDTFSCKFESRLDDVELTKPYQIIIEDLTPVMCNSTSRWNVMAQDLDSTVLLNNTFINPFNQKEVTVSMWSGSEPVNATGFHFVEPECFNKFTDLMETIKVRDLDFEIILEDQ
jgi:hypothetical protein